MSDMEIGDDHIERREVPPGLYNPNGGAPNGVGPYGNGGPPGDLMMVPHPQMVNANGGGGGKKKR